MAIAIIGQGIMGGAYARNLIKSGELVLGVDPSATARASLREAGGQSFEKPGNWIADCELVILSVASPQVLAAVCETLKEFVVPGQIVVETGTFSIKDKEEARTALEDKGAILLDCPVSGTGAQAAEGDLVMMASGEALSIETVRPLLEKFTRLVMNAGAFGNGTRMKFVANHAVAVHNTAAAETLNYADALGLDRETVYRMLSSGAGQSRMSDLRMPLMISGGYEPPSASLRMFKKDLEIIGESIEINDVFAPLFQASSAVYRTANAKLPETFDTAAVFEVFRDKDRS
ncbi:MAG: NAD(P)-dependent oxidoreductase [Roseibium sp.]|uniref:NAD(P)-dependent oxidoreductase n=1 Tax=Roseibium sp. TaxID=1936156 RepID=UPI0026328C6C|nr:NAD(P)-dependent oxidoreductase [Roseibium sp.]MCV0427144.1 NAD(P)-dependent oxidoreductase [Roseibium sp.]